MQRPSGTDALPLATASCSPEQRLVMAMLATPGAGNVWGEPAALSAAVSWERFLARADGMVKPYLHWICNTKPFASLVPPFVVAELAQVRMATQLRNLQWAAELREIVATFRREGISLALVKGAVLQRLVYPHLSTRPMNDIDLVVRRAEMPRVNDALSRLGFRSRTSVDARIPADGFQADEEAHFLKQVADRTLLIEVHTQLEADVGYRSPEWGTCINLPGTDGISVPTLDPCSALRHVCFHLAGHGFEHGLMWLLDIRLFVEKYGDSISWDRLIEECEPEARLLLRFTLKLAADWLGAEIPPSLLTPLPEAKGSEATQLAWRQLWDYPRHRQPLPIVVVMLSGDPRRIWTYFSSRAQRSVAPVPDRQTNRWVLMLKRLATYFRFLRSSYREGGFSLSSIEAARQSDHRFQQLRKLLWPSASNTQHPGERR